MLQDDAQSIRSHRMCCGLAANPCGIDEILRELRQPAYLAFNQ